ITSLSNARRYAVCPTYYSDDPLLTRHFGEAPEHYLDELGAALDPSHLVFWTGPKVISKEYPEAHLESVAQRLDRKPLLWDNYPVNDAKRLTSFLHLRPFANRDPQVLRAHCSGHLSNPMNQGYLSQLPLFALAQHYKKGSNASLMAATDALCSPGLSLLLRRDGERFQDQGLDTLDETTRQILAAEYSALRDESMAHEIIAWLRGEYVFDPACLT